MSTNPNDNNSTTSKPTLATNAQKLFQEGKNEMAEQALRSLIEKQTESPDFGCKHPQTLLSKFNLGILLIKESKFEEAEVVLEECALQRQEVLGTSHEDTIKTLLKLGNLLATRKKDVNARKYLEMYLSIIANNRASIGDNISDVERGNAMLNYGVVLSRLNELPRACEAFGALVQLRRESSTATENKVQLITCLNAQSDILFKLQRFDEAERGYLEVLDLKSSVYGSTHAQTIASKINLAKFLYSQKKFPNTIPLFVDAYEALKQTNGPDHADCYSLLLNIGNAYTNIASPEAAATYYQMYLDVAGPKLGKDHANITFVTSSLALTYFKLGNHSMAFPLFEECLATRRETLGPDHQDTLLVMNNLATSYAETDRLEDAEDLFVECLRRRTKFLGATHAQTLSVVNSLGNLYKKMNKFEKAETHFVNLCDAYRQSLGSKHVDTINAMGNLAFIWKQTGKYTFAEPLYVDILEYRTETLGADHELTIETMLDYSLVAYHQEKYHIAKPILEFCLDVRRKKLGDDNPLCLQVQQNLGNLCYSQGMFAQAEPLFASLIWHHKRKPGGDKSIELINSMQCLSSLYYYQEKYRDAEHVYKDIIEVKTKILGESHTEVVLGMSNLANLYFKLRRYDDAEKLFVKGLELRQSQLGTNHPDVLSFLNNLAATYINLKQFERAERCYKECFQRRREVLGVSHPDTLLCMNNLGTYYANSGRFEEAYSMFSEVVLGRSEMLGPDHPDTLMSVESFEIVKKKWNPRRPNSAVEEPATAVVVVALPEPVIEETESAQPQMHSSIENMSRLVDAKVFDAALSKVSSGLADRMKMLDVTKLRFGGPPPDAIMKKLMAAKDPTVGAQKTFTTAQHPFASDERYRSYIKMKQLGVVEGAIRQKMKAEGFTPKEIDDFFAAAPVEEPLAKVASVDARFLNDPRFAAVIKLKNLRVPEIALRHKMKNDKENNFTQQEIDDFFAPCGFVDEVVVITVLAKFQSDPRFAAVIKLKNLRVPEIALRHRMKTDKDNNFTQEEIDEFFAPIE